MDKYRKKPVTVEAEQFFVGKTRPDGLCTCGSVCESDYHIHGRQGVIPVFDTYWIICPDDGSGRYVAEPGIFEQTYEVAE